MASGISGYPIIWQRYKLAVWHSFAFQETRNPKCNFHIIMGVVLKYTSQNTQLLHLNKHNGNVHKLDCLHVGTAHHQA